MCLNPGNGHKKYAEDLLEIVGLGERIAHYPVCFCKAQQRVSIARALINKPGGSFADEPTASLDVESSLVVLKLFQKLNKEMKQTIQL